MLPKRGGPCRQDRRAPSGDTVGLKSFLFLLSVFGDCLLFNLFYDILMWLQSQDYKTKYIKRGLASVSVSFSSPVGDHCKAFMVCPSIVKKISIMCMSRCVSDTCMSCKHFPINSSIVHTCTVLPFSLVKRVLRSFWSSIS